MLLFEGKLTNVWKWWAHLSASVLKTASKQQALCSARTATKTESIQSTWAFWLSGCDPCHQMKCQRWFCPVWCDPGPPAPAPREPKKGCRLSIAPYASMPCVVLRIFFKILLGWKMRVNIYLFGIQSSIRAYLLDDDLLISMSLFESRRLISNVPWCRFRNN
jgi:hypothetical protein